MKMQRLRPSQTIAVLGLFVFSSVPAGVLAQEHGTHTAAQQQVAKSGAERTSAFAQLVRESTERFRDVTVALKAGYVPQFGCVSGSHEGAMGVHLVDFNNVMDGEFDPTRPELLVYEPLPSGKLKLVAADYLVLTETWHAKNQDPPQLMGQLFHLFESPNRFGLPAFYTLHVWAWKANPQGLFANWNPNVSCAAYIPN